jgi:hypothetical protein
MSLKKAAEDLLKIADDMDIASAKVTEFVCDKCNHTATLETINGKRIEMAKEAGENVTVSEITVNDKIACPACDGVMAYKPTEASQAYYFDEAKEAAKPTKEEIEEEKKETPEEQAKEEKGEKLHAEPHKEASEPVDYDQLDRYLKG